MSDRMDRQELVERVAQRAGQSVESAGEIVDATLEEIVQALKRGECVSLRGFGTFYVRPERKSWCLSSIPPSGCVNSSAGRPRTGEKCSRGKQDLHAPGRERGREKQQQIQRLAIRHGQKMPSRGAMPRSTLPAPPALFCRSLTRTSRNQKPRRTRRTRRIPLCP